MNNIVCSGIVCEAARQNRRMNGLYRFPRAIPKHAQALNVTAFVAEEVPILAGKALLYFCLYTFRSVRHFVVSGFSFFVPCLGQTLDTACIVLIGWAQCWFINLFGCADSLINE